MARRLKKSVKRAIKLSGYTAFVLTVLGLPNILPVFAEAPEDSKVMLNRDVPVYTMNTSTVSASKQILKGVVENTDEVDSSTTDFDKSDISMTGLNPTTPGIQMVNVKATVASNDGSKTNIDQKAVVIVEASKYPTLKLKADEITIDNDGAEHYFLPESFISSVQDPSSGILPTLTVEGADKVDTKTDGYYTVSYKATNSLGYTAERVLTVHVQTPQWLIDQRAKEAEAQAQAEEQARIEAEQKAAEEAQKEAQRIAEEQANTHSNLNYSGGSNPYGGGWSNCTYGAWQALYNARGIALPNLGDASSWYSNAASLGYSVSGTPTAGGIAVYRGHVAYVDAVDGNSVHIVEGGFNGHYNERWVSTWGTGTKSAIGYINI